MEENKHVPKVSIEMPVYNGEGGPLITTIIPTYRRPKLLQRAIRSVLNQTYPHFQICVYDNASGDETEEVVENFSRRDNRVFYFKNSHNIGAVNNIIQGVKAVDTPFYSLLSDDDFLLPDFYANAISAVKKNPDVGFVCAKTIIIDLMGKKIQFRNRGWHPGIYQPSNKVTAKMYASHFVQTGVILNRSMIELIGAFEPSGSDSLYMTIAAASVPFVVLENYGAAVTLHDNAYSIIGEGIAKESGLTLYNNLLISISNIMNIPIPTERKVNVLMFLISSYHQLFDTKRLNHLMGKLQKDEVADIMLLPTLINNRGLLAKIYGLFPSGLHRVITPFLKGMQYLKKVVSDIKSEQNWSGLPEDAYSLLDRADSDVSKLLPYLKLD